MLAQFVHWKTGFLKMWPSRPIMSRALRGFVRGTSRNGLHAAGTVRGKNLS
jgi:hypothetical protein